MAKKAVKPAPKQDPKGLEEALSKSEQFFENNKKTIFGCLIAIIVIMQVIHLTQTARLTQIQDFLMKVM